MVSTGWEVPHPHKSGQPARLQIRSHLLQLEGLLTEFAEAVPWCHMACRSDGTNLEEAADEMCDIAYVDDKCVCLEAESNAELLTKPP